MKRQRVTITIKEDVVNQVDRMVDGLSIRSRSQAVEYLLTKFLTDFRLKNALILAGGREKVKGKPKALADLGQKVLLQQSMDKIHDFGVNNFYVYLDFKADEIKQNLAGRKLAYNTTFLTKEKPVGTVEPLYRVKDHFNDTLLMAYGDTVCSLNLNDMLAFHKKNNSLATIALTTVSNPQKYGVVMLQGNKVNEFIQKPKETVKSFLVSAGYFLFEPEIFKHISRDMKNLELDLFPKLARKGLLYGYPFQGMYLNVNSEQDLRKARALLS
jgi:NDP-sugar pyrophosphorylase family protein